MMAYSYFSRTPIKIPLRSGTAAGLLWALIYLLKLSLSVVIRLNTGLPGRESTRSATK